MALENADGLIARLIVQANPRRQMIDGIGEAFRLRRVARRSTAWTSSSNCKSTYQWCCAGRRCWRRRDAIHRQPPYRAHVFELIRPHDRSCIGRVDQSEIPNEDAKKLFDEELPFEDRQVLRRRTASRPGRAPMSACARRRVSQALTRGIGEELSDAEDQFDRPAACWERKLRTTVRRRGWIRKAVNIVSAGGECVLRAVPSIQAHRHRRRGFFLGRDAELWMPTWSRKWRNWTRQRDPAGRRAAVNDKTDSFREGVLLADDNWSLPCCR